MKKETAKIVIKVWLAFSCKNIKLMDFGDHGVHCVYNFDKMTAKTSWDHLKYPNLLNT